MVCHVLVFVIVVVVVVIIIIVIVLPILITIMYKVYVYMAVLKSLLGEKKISGNKTSYIDTLALVTPACVAERCLRKSYTYTYVCICI